MKPAGSQPPLSRPSCHHRRVGHRRAVLAEFVTHGVPSGERSRTQVRSALQWVGALPSAILLSLTMIGDSPASFNRYGTVMLTSVGSRSTAPVLTVPGGRCLAPWLFGPSHHSPVSFQHCLPLAPRVLQTVVPVSSASPKTSRFSKAPWFLLSDAGLRNEGLGAGEPVASRTTELEDAGARALPRWCAPASTPS